MDAIITKRANQLSGEAAAAEHLGWSEEASDITSLTEAIGAVLDRLPDFNPPKDGVLSPQKEVHIKHARLSDGVQYEKQILEDCAHPNVVECYAMNEDGTELYIEKGEHDLYHHVATAENCQLDVEEVMDIALDVASALGTIHKQGYAHNDLKVENIVMCTNEDDSVDRCYVAKVIDFEFANDVTADKAPPEGEGKVAGTRAYFSPERWFEDDDVDRQVADMWALGVTLHLASFGCFPNGTGESLPILQTDFVAPSGIDPKLATLLENLLKVQPSERWTAADAIRHLDPSSEQSKLDGLTDVGQFSFAFPNKMTEFVTRTSVLSASPTGSPMFKGVPASPLRVPPGYVTNNTCAVQV